MKIFENFNYSTRGELAYIFKYMGTDKKITIPSEIDGFPVNSLNDTFYDNEEIEEIILPSQLQLISGFCFSGCKNLKKITLPETLTSIGHKAFYGCTSLEEVTAPESLEWVNNLILGDRDLGACIFEQCPKLQDEQGFVILNTLLVRYYGENIDITIPEVVTKIADYAFYQNKKLNSVTMSNSVTSIGYGAFFKCQSLSKITLSNNIEIIQNEAFFNCKSLECIKIPDSLKKINVSVFWGCAKLHKIEWGNSLEVIYTDAFAKCTSLEVVHLPAGLTYIDKTFSNCTNLKEVTIPASVNMIGEKSFYKCNSLETVNFLPRPDGMEGWLTTQTGCFSYTDKMRENLLNNGQTLHDRVVSGFNKKDHEKYTLDQITQWDYLSQDEKNIFLEEWKKKITTKVKKGKNRFRNMVFLESTAKEMAIYFNEGFNLELPELDEYLEYSIENNNTVETALLLDYKNKTYSKDYLEEQETRKEMLEIGLEMPTLKELRLKWSVKVSKEYITITGYKGKNTHEVIPEAIDKGLPIRYLSTTKTLLENSSYNPIEHLVLPENLENIENRCFNHSNLKEVILPKSMTEISVSMFSGASNLQKIILHEGIKNIEENAFGSCSRLEEIQLPDSLEIIGVAAFCHSFRLIEICFTKNLKKVSERAFSGCDKLEKVILANETTLDIIDPTAFENCKKLKFIGIKGGENLLSKFLNN